MIRHSPAWHDGYAAYFEGKDFETGNDYVADDEPFDDWQQWREGWLQAARTDRSHS